MKTRIRNYLRLLALTCPIGAGCSGDEPHTPANLIVIALDTLRPDHLGLYGYERPTSPRLDALADEFFVFENAQSAAPWTAPSLISLMTSLYPDVHQVAEHPRPGRLGAGTPLLAEYLRGAGFATAAFTEGAYAGGAFGLDRGFDVFEANLSDSTDALEENVGQLIDWVEGQRARSERFFGYLHTYGPHTPRNAPESYIQLFAEGYDYAAESEQLHAACEAWNAERKIDAAGLLLVQRHALRSDPPELEDRDELIELAKRMGLWGPDDAFAGGEAMQQWVIDLYDAEVRYLDDQLNRLWRYLKESNLEGDTIVVIVSDHGEGLGDHGRQGHGGSLVEELLRVVLMARLPSGAGEPRRVVSGVQTVDVVPTVLDALGVTIGASTFQGISLLPLMRGDVPALQRPSFSHATFRANQHSVRDGHWRLVVDDESGSATLFDLKSDPGEETNVVESNPKVAARLRLLLDEQREVDRLLREKLDSPLEPVEVGASTLKQLDALGYK